MEIKTTLECEDHRKLIMVFHSDGLITVDSVHPHGVTINEKDIRKCMEASTPVFSPPSKIISMTMEVVNG